ncbi:unnamed protein product [Closterium sp. Naga37s-1]|nr:unnamed protein product [Closterium sp. Naga37s-1]
MPVAVGGGSPVPYSPRPFGVASAALASPALSAPVAPVAAMSAAGSPAHASSTVVDSGRESAGVLAPPRVLAPVPVPAFVLAPAAGVAPLPDPDAAPPPAPHAPVEPSPAAAAADCAAEAPASGVAPLPAPAAASHAAPHGGSAPPLPVALSSAPAQPLGPQQRPSRPHSPSQRDERAGSRHRRDSPRQRRPQANWHAHRGGWVGGHGRGRGGWQDAPATIADVRQIVTEAFRDGQAGSASLSSSRRAAPSPLAPLPVPRLAVAPPVAAPHPVPSAPVRGAGAGFPPVRLPSLAAELLPPRVEVPEATLGQLWRLSESLRGLLLVQSLAHGSLPPVPAQSLLEGPREDCLDAADQLALLLAPVLAAPVRGGVGAVGQLDAAVRDLRRREDVSKEHTSSGSFPWSIVLTRAWRWVVTAALAIAASLRCSNVIPDGPPPTPFSQRHRIFANAAEVMVTTWASSVGVQSMCPGGVASPPVGSRSPGHDHAPQLAAARLCLLVMPVAVGGGSPVPYSPRPFGMASAALASSVRSAPVAPVAAMSVAAPVPAFVLAPAAGVAHLPAPGSAPSPAPHVPVLPSPAETAAVAGVAPASGEAPPPAPVALPVASPAASQDALGGKSAPPLPAASSSAHALPPGVQQRNSRPHSPSPRDERDVSRRRRDSPRRRLPQANWHAHQGGWRGGRGRGRGGWLDAPATIADVRQIVTEAFRDGQAGPASQYSSRRAAPTPSAPLPVARPVVAPAPAVSLPAPLAPAHSGGAGLPRLQLPSLAEELLPPRAEVPEATLGQLWRLSESLRALLLVQSLAHGSRPPVPAESLLDGPRDDCLDAADQIALLLAPVLAAPVRGGVGAVGQLDAAVRDLRRYLRAGSGADAIGAAILVVRSAISEMPPSSEAAGEGEGGEGGPDSVYLWDWVINPQASLYQQFQAALLLLAILIGFIEPFNVAFLDTENVLTPVNVFIYCTDAVSAQFGASGQQGRQGETCSSHVPRPAPPQVFLSDVLLSFFVPEFRMGEWKTSLASIAVECLCDVLMHEFSLHSPFPLSSLTPPPPPSPPPSPVPHRTKHLLLPSHIFFHSLTTYPTLLILFAAHWSACVFFLLSRVRNFSEDTPDLPLRPPLDAYVTSIYWAMTTLSTTGTAPQVLQHRYCSTGTAAQVLHHRRMWCRLQEQVQAHLKLHFDTAEVQLHLKLHFDAAEVRDDVLLHCPSSVRTLVKRHVYSRFINSSYLFAVTSNLFRVSPPPYLVLTPPLTSPLACAPPTCFVNSSYLFAGTSNLFRVSLPPYLVLTPPLTSPLACAPPTCFVNSSYLFAGTSNIFRVSEGPTMLPPSHAAALPCCHPPIPSAHTTHPTHLTLPVSLYHPSDQVATRANVDFFLPHVDLVAAGNSTTELLIIASGHAQVLVRGKNGNEMQWFVLHEGDCEGGECGAYEFCQAFGDVVRASERSAMGGRAKEDLGRVVSKPTESSRALFLSSTLSTSLMCCPTPIRPSLDSPEIAFLCDLTELWTVRTLSVCRVLPISRDDYRSVARTHPADDRHVPISRDDYRSVPSPTCSTGECSVPIHASPSTPFLIHLLSRARSRAEATARFYPGNSTMAELSLLLKNEVEPVLNGIDIFFFYPLSHTFANRSLAPTPSSPTLPHSPCHASLSAFTASSVGAAMRPCRDVFHFLHPGFHTLPAHSVPILQFSSAPPRRSSPPPSPVLPQPLSAGDADEPSFRNRLVQETLMNLCYAAKRGDMLECFRLAAGGFDVAAADYDGRTPMHLAAVTGQDKVVPCNLLPPHHFPSLSPPFPSPLFPHPPRPAPSGAAVTRQDKVVAFLLAHGAQVNAKDAFWRTPLQEAVAAGHWSTAQILRRSALSATALPLLCQAPRNAEVQHALAPALLCSAMCTVPSLLLTCWHSFTSFALHYFSPSYLSRLPFSLQMSPSSPLHRSPTPHISSQPPGNGPAVQSPEAHVPSRLLHHHRNHPAHLSLPVSSPLPVLQPHRPAPPSSPTDQPSCQSSQTSSLPPHPSNGGELHLRNQGTHLWCLASSSSSCQLAHLPMLAHNIPTHPHCMLPLSYPLFPRPFPPFSSPLLSPSPPPPLSSNGGELHLRNQGTHLCRLATSSNSHQLARLLEFGADPNSADYDGRTALHVAAAEGHLNVVKVLSSGFQPATGALSSASFHHCTMALPEVSSAADALAAGPHGKKPADVRPEPVTPKTLFNGASSSQGGSVIKDLTARTSALRINDLPAVNKTSISDMAGTAAPSGPNAQDRGKAKEQDAEDDDGYLSDDPDECQDPVTLNEIAAQAGVAITLLVPFNWSKEILRIFNTVNHLLLLWGKHMSENVKATTRCQQLPATFLSKQHFGRIEVVFLLEADAAFMRSREIEHYTANEKKLTLGWQHPENKEYLKERAAHWRLRCCSRVCLRSSHQR